MFRDAMQSRGAVQEFAIDQMQPLPTKAGEKEALAEIFAAVDGDRLVAARKTLGYVRAGGSIDAWVDEARRILLIKGRGAHDYKFACSVFEDVRYVSEQWRGFYLAGAVFSLLGTAKEDNPLIERTREALTG
jgi:hypothetical protein